MNGCWLGRACFWPVPIVKQTWGAVRFAGVSFQVRRVLRGRRDLDVAKLTERTLSGRYGVADLKDLAATLGGLIANGHARAGHPLALWNVLAKSDGIGRWIHCVSRRPIAK